MGKNQLQLAAMSDMRRSRVCLAGFRTSYTQATAAINSKSP
jgi:hypothetical protein